MEELKEKETEIVLSKNNNEKTQLGLSQTTAESLQATEIAADEIKKQNFWQQLFSTHKNEQALAENDKRISKVIKDILNFCFLVASAETIRKEEYEDLTNRMIGFDEYINSQIQMQVKFKQAYEKMQERQAVQENLQGKVNKLIEENEKLKKETEVLKKLSIGALAIGVIAVLLVIIL